MENNYPIYKILSSVAFLIGACFFMLEIFPEGELIDRKDIKLVRIFVTLNLSISGLIGLFAWRIGRGILAFSFCLYIIMLWYFFLVDYIPDGKVFLLELTILMNVILSSLLTSMCLILFNVNTYNSAADRGLVNSSPFSNQFPMDKILSMTVLGFGIASMASMFSPMIFLGKSISGIENTAILVTLSLFAIGILGLLFWKVIRILLGIILLFLLLFALYAIFDNEDSLLLEQIGVFISTSSICIGFILLFFNKNLTADYAVSSDFYENQDVLDEL